MPSLTAKEIIANDYRTWLWRHGVIAFKQFIPVPRRLPRGDEIAILNGEVGEFNGVPQVKIGPNTRVVSVRTSKMFPNFDGAERGI